MSLASQLSSLVSAIGADIKSLFASLSQKAPIASPAFTGTVSAPQNYNVSSAYGAMQVAGADVLRFGSDTSGQLAGFRNKLINGGFDVWQRGTSVTAAAGVVTYTADRWYVYASGSNQTTYRFTASLGTKYSNQFAVVGAAGNTACSLGQRIESFNSRFNTGTVTTLSARIVSPDSRTLTVALYSADSLDTFSTKTLVGTATFNLVTGANNVVVKLPATTAACCNGMAVELQFGALTSGTIYVANVQLEEGSIATPFEQLPYTQTVALCRDYYDVFSFTGLTGITYTSNGDTRSFIPIRQKSKTRSGASVTYSGGTSVIAYGDTTNVVNVSMGTLTLALSTFGIRIANISNYAAFSGAGAVVSWGSGDGQTFVINNEL